MYIPAFAESHNRINIPTGSGAPSSTFHWQTVKGGDTSGKIQIAVNEFILWKNGDTVTHTVTSGTPETGFDETFNSGPLAPGKMFEYQFTETGTYPYYCTIHPWRLGLVTVTSGLNIIPNVGAGVGDGMTAFDVEYDFNRVINMAKINDDANSITLELKGNTRNEDNTLMLMLPSALISGISAVSVDGQATEFTQELKGDITTLTIGSVLPYSKSITITGAHVVPEFSGIVMGILIISIVGIILATRSDAMRLPH